MEEEQKQAYLKILFELVDDAADAHGIEMLMQKLHEIKHKHGALGLQDVLNTLPTGEDAKPGIAILDHASIRRVEATKLLLINGASPFKKAFLSSMTGKLIIAAMQQKKGKTFSPTFIDYSRTDVAEQLQQVEAYLKHFHDQVLTDDISSPPISKTFIIATGPHWSCCQMQFSKSSSGDPELQMFFLDASGLKYWNDGLSDLCKMSQGIFNAAHIKIYRNALSIQSDSGCKIFTLIFARMLHSITFGKFKQVNPSYDLFADLATRRCQKVQLDGVSVTDLTDLPAKFLQLNQRVGEQKMDLTGTVNSQGRTLGSVLYENIKPVTVTRFGQEVRERHNTKLTTKFTTMREMIQNFFSHAKSDEEKLALLNSIEFQFSTANLPMSKPVSRRTL